MRVWKTNISVAYVHILVLHYLLTYFHIKIFARVKQNIIYLIPCEHRQFWQLSQLDDFSINAVANLFIPERLKIPEAHSEPSQTSKMELFAEMVNS